MTENQFEPIMAAIQTLTVKFESRFDKMEGRFDKLEGRLDNVESQLVVINGELKRIQHWTPYNENHDIMARLEAIKGSR